MATEQFLSSPTSSNQSDDQIPSKSKSQILLDPPAGLMSDITVMRSNSERQLRNARAFLAKYDLQLAELAEDVRPRGAGERVHKNVRIRVRYTCHNCQTSFGRDRTCSCCQHRRCSRCPRYPPKRDRSARNYDTALVAESSTTGPTSLSEVTIIRMAPTATSDPRPDATNKSSQQVYACHECQTDLDIDAEECPRCHHQVCEKCLLEVADSAEDEPPKTAAAIALDSLSKTLTETALPTNQYLPNKQIRPPSIDPDPDP